MSVFTILYRNIKWRFHNSFTIIVTILQPVLWLVLYSAVASQTMQGTGIVNYTGFILPGLIVLVSFSACSSGGIMNYMMKADGSFYRILIAPVRRTSIVLGQLLEAVLCTFLEVFIMGAISLLFSVEIAADIGAILLAILLVFLEAFFISGMAYGISLILPNEVVYETVMNAIVLPLFFLSTALFPAGGIDGILGVIVNLNPFTHIINALRSLLLNGTLATGELLFVFILYTVMGGSSFGWALHRLNRETAL